MEGSRVTEKVLQEIAASPAAELRFPFCAKNQSF
jgi:hypothetical protein